MLSHKWLNTIIHNFDNIVHDCRLLATIYLFYIRNKRSIFLKSRIRNLYYLLDSLPTILIKEKKVNLIN